MDKKGQTTSWSWKMSDEELKSQVDGYTTLKITESYRGVTVIIISALLLLSLVLGYFDITSFEDVIYSLFIYIPLLFFVYKGHRWAIVILFILWTIEKAASAYIALENGGGVISSLIWFFIVAPYIYKALLVENERRKVMLPEKSTSSLDGGFCSKCGTKQMSGSKFCNSCGNQL